MALNNASTVKEILTATGRQVSEGVPSYSVVLNANPKDYRTATVLASSNPTTSGTVTVLTSSSIRETFISGLVLAINANATCDIATGQIAVNVVINGKSQVLAAIPVITTTAQNINNEYQIYPAVKVDKNSAITVTGTYTLGTMSRVVVLHGYEVESNEA